MAFNPQNIAELLTVVKTKHQLDKHRDWSNDSATYLGEIRKELDEVVDEMDGDRQCYLEDELGDVFWDYLNLLYSLEGEGRIDLAQVFERALSKYKERVDTLVEGGSWNEVKNKQKQRLAQEVSA